MHPGAVEWLALAALLAGVVVLPRACQRLWGRPEIEIAFDESVGNNSKVLVCHLYNRPIRNRFLRRIGVRRESARVTAEYMVIDKRSGKRVVDLTQAVFVRQDQSTAKEIDLPPAMTRTTLGIALAKDSGVFVLENRQGAAKPLPAGTFHVPLVVHCGAKRFEFGRHFVVKVNPRNSVWADD